MLALAFKFIAGRYHATQWGENVNEGMPDWPPSPWRIIRAIISVWHVKLNSITKEEIEPILKKMIENKVCFYLPYSTRSHTRHYMPTWNSTTKIIDSFVAVSPNESVVAIWNDVSLDDKQKEIINNISKSIQYLGRAESWCDVQHMEKDIPEPNCSQIEDYQRQKTQTVKVLVPNKNTSIEEICVETKELHKNHIIDPPGSQWVWYTLPDNRITTQESKTVQKPMNVMRYKIAGNVRPKITETIMIADCVRKAIMSKYGKSNQGAMSQIFSGKDEKGNHAKNNHKHAFFLPTDEDGDNIIEHMTVVTTTIPFNQKEINAMAETEIIRCGQSKFKMIFQERGKLNDFNGIPVLQKSTRWASITPYVLNRHMKIRKKDGKKYIIDGPEEQLRKEIDNRFNGNITIKNIQIQDSKSKMITKLMPIQFKRWRKDRLPGFGAYNILIEFNEEVQGPLSFGHGSHFGLGMCIPAET